MSVGDFKVIDINDEGTSSKFGGDDLDKINKILNGEDLELDILIDNEWSFKHNKLVIRDFTGDYKLKVGTSTEAADWSIIIPTLGGNRTLLFTDLAQEITEKDIDADNNTVTNIRNTNVASDAGIIYSKLDLDDSIITTDLVDDIITTVKILDGNVTDAKIDSVDWSKLTSIPDATVLEAGIVQLGDSGDNIAGLAIQANDTRLYDSRDPNVHATSHGSGQSDEIAIDWSQITTGIPDDFIPSDHATEHITGGGDIIPTATITETGLLPILSDTATEYLDGTGNWSTPSFGSVSIDDLSDVDTTTVTPVDNYVLTYSSGSWIAAEPPGASGGEANTLTNVGAEIELVKPKVGVNYDIRTLLAGTNISITQNADTVTIDATDTNTVTDALTDLTVDVLITTPADGEVLTYDSATSKWINAVGGSSSVTAFDDLTDVTITTAADGQLVKYESASSLWKNVSPNIEVVGVAKADGDNATTQFIIPHGVSGVSSSSYCFVDVASHAFTRTWEIDSTNITVDLSAAPANGTDNVIIYWRIIP